MSDTTERTDHAAAISLGREWNAVWKQLERDVTLATSHRHDRTWIEIAYRTVRAAIDQGIVVDAAENAALRSYAREVSAILHGTDIARHGQAAADELEQARMRRHHITPEMLEYT